MRVYIAAFFVSAVFSLLLPHFKAPDTAWAASTEFVSMASNGWKGSGASDWPSISADGRYVAFSSLATNLVENDTNYDADIFVHDRQTGVTTRVSVASDGTEGNGDSESPSISPDGRYVAFHSRATNLVPADTNGVTDVFVHDRQTGTTTRASVASDSAQANGGSYSPSICTGGTYVAFQSDASNLVAGDINETGDIFVHAGSGGATNMLSVSETGSQGQFSSSSPDISPDCGIVAFQTSSQLVNKDNNNVSDIYTRGVQSGLVNLASVAADGSVANDRSNGATISTGGQYIAYSSFATNLVTGDTNGAVDVFVSSPSGGGTARVSVSSEGVQANAWSDGAAISDDGAFVAFFSGATNLVANDTNGYTDIFVKNLDSGSTTRASVDTDGVQGNNQSLNPAIAEDGRYIAFSSDANNLVSGDYNGVRDVFLRDTGKQGAPSNVGPLHLLLNIPD